MFISPLDMDRMAVRIERLQQTSTHGWHPADELDFRNRLPGGRVRGTLPEPKMLRDLANEVRAGRVQDAMQHDIREQWNMWLHSCNVCEGHIRDNDPRNPKRMMRDIARGRFPFR